VFQDLNLACDEKNLVDSNGFLQFF